MPALVLWSCVPSFCPLCRFVLGALSLNMALFRVLRAFLARFVWVCVGLCGLRALRGLWGFCVRERLGGLKACGVFASLFVLLPISFCLSFYLFAPAFCPVFLLLVLLCSGCFSLLSFLICVCVFFFPCGLHAKRKGAKVFPCVLSSCVVGLFGCSDSCNVIEELRGRCFGSF